MDRIKVQLIRDDAYPSVQPQQRCPIIKMGMPHDGEASSCLVVVLVTTSPYVRSIVVCNTRGNTKVRGGWDMKDENMYDERNESTNLASMEVATSMYCGRRYGKYIILRASLAVCLSILCPTVSPLTVCALTYFWWIFFLSLTMMMWCIIRDLHNTSFLVTTNQPYYSTTESLDIIINQATVQYYEVYELCSQEFGHLGHDAIGCHWVCCTMRSSCCRSHTIDDDYAVSSF